MAVCKKRERKTKDKRDRRKKNNEISDDITGERARILYTIKNLSLSLDENDKTMAREKFL